MGKNTLAYFKTKMKALKEYGINFWKSKSKRTKVIIITTAAIGVVSVGTIGLVRFHSLQQAKKFTYALVPVAKNALSKSMQLRNGCFFDKPFCQKILRLHNQEKSIFDYIYYRNLDLTYLSDFLEYMSRKQGEINYISPYIAQELYRICYLSKKKEVPLLLDNIWKL